MNPWDARSYGWNYWTTADATCKHDVIDNGTRVSECRTCKIRMELRGWDWVEAPERRDPSELEVWRDGLQYQIDEWVQRGKDANVWPTTLLKSDEPSSD